MESNNISILISVAALILSIVSPVVSAWIAGHYKMKEKEIDYIHGKEQQAQAFYLQHKAEVIEKYIKSAGVVIKSNGLPDSKQKFGEAMGEIYLYIAEPQWPLIDNVSRFIAEKNYEQAEKSLVGLCKYLSAYNVRATD